MLKQNKSHGWLNSGPWVCNNLQRIRKVNLKYFCSSGLKPDALNSENQASSDILLQWEKKGENILWSCRNLTSSTIKKCNLNTELMCSYSFSLVQSFYFFTYTNSLKTNIFTFKNPCFKYNEGIRTFENCKTLDYLLISWFSVKLNWAGNTINESMPRV